MAKFNAFAPSKHMVPVVMTAQPARSVQTPSVRCSKLTCWPNTTTGRRMPQNNHTGTTSFCIPEAGDLGEVNGAVNCEQKKLLLISLVLLRALLMEGRWSQVWKTKRWW